ncbi:unnamed protein product [Owenia fusiformis]|uniref:Uncharacterized protein n=1 Tax=Owenia fusiformis TaxID=6347 RepID=A0A8S4NPT7_OWEFU|nr:unnamed protein product [Owenia fusiformis]
MAGMGSIYSIMNSGRLVLVVILARIFLKERINFIKLFTVIISIAGIISVTQPDLIFKYVKSSVLLRRLWTESASGIDDHITNTSATTIGTTNICPTNSSISTLNSSNGTTNVPESIPPIWQGYIIVFIDAVNVSILTISTSTLIKKTTSSPEMFFNMSAVGIFLTGIGICFEGFKTPKNLHDVLCIIGFTVGSIGYNIGYIITMKLIPASLASILFTFTIVLGVILQYTIFHSSYSGHANILEILGCCLVIISILLIPVQNICLDENNKHKKATLQQVMIRTNKDVVLTKSKTFEFPQLYKSNE